MHPYKFNINTGIRKYFFIQSGLCVQLTVWNSFPGQADEDTILFLAKTKTFFLRVRKCINYWTEWPVIVIMLGYVKSGNIQWAQE